VKSIDILQTIPYFAGLPRAELLELCGASQVVTVSDGEAVIAEGDPASDLLVVAEGTFQAFRRSAAGDTLLGSAGPGQVLGEMALLEKRPASATVRALGPATLVRVPGAEFRRVLSNPRLLEEMLRTVTARLREREAALIQTEKLASLGTLTAGLLHEVNNPAAAISRAASNLMKMADELVPDRPVASGEPVPGPLLRADRERKLGDLLIGLDAVERAELSASLVAQGWDDARLSAIDETERSRTARLVHTRQLAGEVAMAAGRLSDIVATVKRWTYHDQGLSQEVDLNQSVTDSLTLLRPKAAGRSVDVELETDLGLVEGRGSELSQIVTNLIDNALDAAASRVVVRTRDGKEGIVVEVEDDGAGIPPDLASRIWEPFFTTKPPGKGTGLGLALVQRIAADHQGRIEFDSVPGRTRFRLVLPRWSKPEATHR
jgi:signal transduction histidine kinase